MTPLTAYVSRFLEGKLEKALGGPVLLVEPRAKKGAEGESEFQFRTASGVGTPAPGEGDSYVLEIRKHKDNAFRRGVTLGRTANNDLVIDDGSVSRFHAWFQLDTVSGEWTVADAGSKNGTKLGRAKLAPKKATELRGGEHLRFGKVEARFLTPKGFVALLKARLG